MKQTIRNRPILILGAYFGIAMLALLLVALGSALVLRRRPLHMLGTTLGS